MSISIYTSNSIKELSSAMVADLKRTDNDIFRPQYIITQTEGMNSWLKHQIAATLGIAANLKFVSPNVIIEELLLHLEGQSLNYKIKRQHLDWLIYLVLEDGRFQKRFPVQAAYYKDSEMKQWEFSAKLSDLFDQYQIYRSETIRIWNSPVPTDTFSGDEQWQAYIWRALRKKTQNDIYDITEVKHHIVEKIRSPEVSAQLKAAFPELILFGLSIITPVHLELFHELSQHISIKWYLSNPAPDDYWMDDQSEKGIFRRLMKGKNIHHLSQGNDLLTSWGLVTQQTFRMMFQTDTFINAIEDLPRVLPDAQKLLGAVQQDIFYNNTRKPAFTEAQLLDGSISIQDHYSIRREVEGVYNYLAGLIQQERIPGLQERDIVVMVTDINAYAPFIRAVMDNAPYKFQYTIADERIANGDTLISAFIELLEFNGSLFSAESVLKLLNSKYIRAKFHIHDLAFLRSAMEKASIKFGISNDYEEHTDDTYLVSWRYGSQKLMYGMCMATEEQLSFGEKFYPVAVADNTAEMHQLTALVAFVEALDKMVKGRSGAKTLKEWETYFEELLNDLVHDIEQESDEEQAKMINNINQNDKIDAPDLKINFEVIAQRFINALSNESKQKHFINKGITFCSPLPFRSIPFKVVAMLGLNHDKFPRKEQRSYFDLINKRPRNGDRNVKNNDKHLFLESILSASDALYLSYIGRSSTNNRTIPPSSLVDELLEYIQLAFDNLQVADILVQRHPLQTYSFRYNKDDIPLAPNYLIQPSQKWPLSSADDIAKEQPAVFELSELWKYFNRSIEYYYNDVLGVYFEAALEEIDDAELFEVDHLQDHQIRTRLLAARIQGEESEEEQKIYLNARLPLKNVGLAHLDLYREKVALIARHLEQDEGGTRPDAPIPVSYDHRGYRFQGKLSNVIGGRLFGVDWNNKERNRAKLYFEYLWAKACDVPVEQALLLSENGQQRTITLSAAEARSILHRLLDFFIDNRQKPCVYSIYFYDGRSKVKQEDYIIKLKKLLEHQPYHKYLRHALQTMDKATLDETFVGMNEIINEIFLTGYEK